MFFFYIKTNIDQSFLRDCSEQLRSKKCKKKDLPMFNVYEAVLDQSRQNSPLISDEALVLQIDLSYKNNITFLLLPLLPNKK